jgi:hypothetical protein
LLLLFRRWGRLYLTVLSLLLFRRWRWWLNLTLRRGRLYLTLLSSLLPRRWGRRLHLPLLSLLLSRRWRWWLNLLRGRWNLTLLWRWRARPLRRLFLLFLVCLGRLSDHKPAIEGRRVCWSKNRRRQDRDDQ